MSTDDRGTQWDMLSVVKRSWYRYTLPGITLALHGMVSVNYWFVFEAFRLLTLVVVNINLMPSNVLITGNHGPKNSRAITVVATEADRCWMEAGGKCRCNWYLGLVNTLQWRHMGSHHRQLCLPSWLFIINDWWCIKAPHYRPFVRGIYRWPVDSTHKGTVTRTAFLLHNVIMTVNLRKYV